MFTLLKKVTSSALILALLVTSIVVAPAPAYAATIFSDDFNSGTFSAWTVADDEWDIINDNHSSPKAAQIDDTDAGDDELRKNVSTVGYTGVTLSYWYKIPGGLASDEELMVQWYDGSTWTTIVNYDSTGTMSNWASASHPLPAGAANNANFRLRFLGESLSNDQFRLDDVVLSGTALPPPNIPPVAMPGLANTNEDTAVAITLVATDFNGDTLTYSIVSNPSHGTLSGTGSSRTYTPAANYFGADTFTFKANDGTVDSNVATITVTVLGTNDNPNGSNDVYSTAQDTVLSVGAPGVLANDTDIDGDGITAQLNTGPAHGTLTLNPDGSFDYTPDAGYVGDDSFTYFACDSGQSGSITVTIHVTNTPDAPVAVADTYTVAEDATLTVPAVGVLANDTDPDSDPITAILGANVTNGSLTLNADGSFVYTPNANYFGSDSFTYKANDGSFDSGVVTVTITVDPVNDAPVAVDAAVTTPQDTPVSGTLGATDTEGSALTFVHTPPANGMLSSFDSATGAYTYTPALGFSGTDSFTFQANDGTDSSNTGTITITVNAVVPPTPACADGSDNDGDSLIDMNDPGCSSSSDNDETDPAPAPASTPTTGGGGGGGVIGGPLGVMSVAPTSAGNGQILGISTTTVATPVLDCPAYLTEYIRLGARNNPAEVTKLQEFLNTHEGTTLAVSGEYDQASYSAVIAFQDKYFGDVMGPWGARTSTGYVYYTTQKKINELHCAMTKAFPLTAEQEAEIARIKALTEAAATNPAVPTTPEMEEVGVEADTTQTATVVESEAGAGIWGGISNFFKNLW